jgi:4-amino-4-deoxy-L-arabinose transferase-like glycosyltransferase
MFHLKSSHLLTILLLITFILSAYKSWSTTIYMSDELLIEDIAYGMAHGDSLILPTVNGLPSLLKPPLLYWITAPLYSILPVIPITRRLPMIIFSLGLVAMTYFLTKKLFDERVAFWSGILLSTSVPLIYFTKTTYFDLPNTFFAVTAIYLFIKAVSEKRNFYYFLSGTTIALAILNRSYLALFIPILLLLYSYLNDGKIKLRVIFYILIYPILMVLPWHLLAFHESPQNFLSQYIFFPFAKHVVSNIGGDFETSPLFYLKMFILFPPALLSVWFFIKENKSFQPIKNLLSLWFILYMAPLLVSKTKYEWYLMPVYPLLSMAAAAFIVHILPTIKPLIRSQIWGFIIVSICVGPILLFSTPLPEAENIMVANIYIATKSDKPLYITRYPLVPVTRFYLGGKAEIISPDLILQKFENHDHFFVIARPETAATLPKPQKIFYQSHSYFLGYF